MQNSYNFKNIEKKAQKYWEKFNLYKSVEYEYDNKNQKPKPKFYSCSMLPYPSGNLHIGHVRNYTINDVINRYMRMNNYSVLMPMGWDAFGMPAENAAIKNNISPSSWIKKNIIYMKKQMKSLGLSIDWSKEIKSCDKSYYKWNQWLFLKMLKNNIVYRKKQLVNWDPIDKTVLSNEQIINNRGWRSGALVKNKEINVYYLRITKYANELLEFIKDKLNGWPKKVILMQKKWIGKEKGFIIKLQHRIFDTNNNLFQNGMFYSFTKSISTIMGVTFCLISLDNPLIKILSKKNHYIYNFVQKNLNNNFQNKNKSFKYLEGMNTGFYVYHPVNGNKIELCISNYFINNFYKHILMCVPAHNKLDFIFAKKYRLPIKQVVLIKSKSYYNYNLWKEYYKDTKSGLIINSFQFNNLNYKEAEKKISIFLIQNKLCNSYVKWNLKDWSISRQRYWGTPIPILHCKNCGILPLKTSELPTVLPKNLIPSVKGNILSKNKEFIYFKCTKCGRKAKRETDTMDTFIDSSWYFIKYLNKKNKFIVNSNLNKYWMPVDQYIGGIEHAILHLLYSRFWIKVMRDLKLISFDEPFINLMCQGMVLNTTYLKNKNYKIEYCSINNVNNIYDKKGNIVGAKKRCKKTFIKYNGICAMSKSKNNGINPNITINKFGADTVRLFVIFSNSPENSLEWSSLGIKGSNNYLHRIWKIAYKYRNHIKEINSKKNKKVNNNHFHDKLSTNIIIDKINKDYKKKQYNTVISGNMKLLKIIENTVLNNKNITFIYEIYGIILRFIYPIVPHIAWNIWNNLEYFKTYGNILNSKWPKFNKLKNLNNKLELDIHINGKLKEKIEFNKNSFNKYCLKKNIFKKKYLKIFLNNLKIKKNVLYLGKFVNLIL